MSMMIRRLMVVLCTVGMGCSDSDAPERPQVTDSGTDGIDEPTASDGGSVTGSGDAGPLREDGGREDAGDRSDAGGREDAGGIGQNERDGGGMRPDADAGDPPVTVDPEPLDLGEPCPEGSACAEGLECESASGRCCPPGKHCCDIASDCPSSYSDERGCLDPSICRSSIEVARCVDSVCTSIFAASTSDASGCAGIECTPLSCTDGVIDFAGACDVDGACVQPAQDSLACDRALDCADDACRTECVPGTSEGCRSHHTCSADGTTCVTDANEGADCSQAAGGPAVCAGNTTCNPVNERCCVDGLCCATAADCPASAGDVVYEGAVCADVATCSGELRTKQCTANRCVSSSTPDGAVCNDLACPTGSCDAGLCVGRGKGEACAGDVECASGHCLTNGFCGADIGEPCTIGGGDCAHARLCWNGDATSQTGRCFPAECGEGCSYWRGGPEGACDGVVQPFMPSAPGLPGAVCYDDPNQPGALHHEINCSNGWDDDVDGFTDGADPDCIGANLIWLETTGRGPGAQCVWPSCGAVVSTELSQCSSGVGGCFDAACHSTICFPNAGGCAGLTPTQGICKWWHGPRDLDLSCGANEIIDRPEGSACGAGCTCRDGAAEEFLCKDGRDNDYDGLVDADDPDCMRTPGQRCAPARWNGAPDPGDDDRRVSGFVGDEDQCAGADLCWCADANCTRGVCLDDQATCATDAAFLCNSYPNASATSCGAAVPRPNGVAAYPPAPFLGICQGGSPALLGMKQPGEACSLWSECASGQCSCGNADCSARVCWAPEDCAGNLCQYRVDASTCRPVVSANPAPVACGGGDFMGIDLRQSCRCLADPTGTMTMQEAACDDGISNDWSQPSAGSLGDTMSDWNDVDCVGLHSPWHISMFLRYALF